MNKALKIPLSLRRPPMRYPVVPAVCMVLAQSMAVQAQAQTASGTASAAAAGAMEIGTVNVTGATAGANPNADPAAPYKVERSASDKYTKPLLDIPKSITVISKEQIKDSGATSVKDVMRIMPGITLGTGEGGNAYGDRFIIRGYEARNDV